MNTPRSQRLRNMRTLPGESLHELETKVVDAHDAMYEAIKLVLDDLGDTYGGPTWDALRAAKAKAEEAP